jgi:regulator of sirC expression with transglutaminase-like and TPR domain
MFQQREAIIRLLKDEDRDTVNLTKQQLAEGGAETIPDLRDLLAIDDKQVTAHVREILSQIEVRYAKALLEQICVQIDRDLHLEQACWCLAQVFLPGVGLDVYHNTIDLWGRLLKDRLAKAGSNTTRVLIMAQFLGRELGFQGNADDYYNAKNSLLPAVIDSKLGIPISLSVLYMIVASRAGITVDGINLPGHFVVRHGDVLFDPFHKGRILTTRECSEILAHQNLTLQMSHLQRASPKLILTRILANLSYIFEREADETLYRMVTQWMRLLDFK